jgi:hypothetical protein
MPQNMIKLVESVKREYQLGMPDGMDDSFLKRIQYLFKRIEELEAVAVPFARSWFSNKDFNVEMLEVYKSDCKRAFDAIDSRNAYIPEQKYEIPAE